MDEQSIQKTVGVKRSSDVITVEFRQSVNTVDENIRQAEIMIAHVKALMEESERVKGLVDLTMLKGIARFPSPRARDLYLSLMEDSRLVKIAYVAPDMLSRSVIRFILKSQKPKARIKVFRTKEEALRWL